MWEIWLLLRDERSPVASFGTPCLPFPALHRTSGCLSYCQFVLTFDPQPFGCSLDIVEFSLGGGAENPGDCCASENPSRSAGWETHPEPLVRLAVLKVASVNFLFHSNARKSTFNALRCCCWLYFLIAIWVKNQSNG